MVYRKPTSLVANRPFVLNGVTIAKGTTLSKAQAKSIRHLEAFLNDGTLRAEPDPHYRKIKPNRTTPTNLPPSVRSSLTT